MLGGVVYELYLNLKKQIRIPLKKYALISLTLDVYNELEIVHL